MKFTQPLGEIVDRFEAADARPIQAKRKSGTQLNDTMGNLPEKKVLPVVINDAVVGVLAGAHAAADASAAQCQHAANYENGDRAMFLQTNNWAAKRNKNWVTLSASVVEALTEMFDAAMSHPKDASKRYNAERATMQLKESILEKEWDQQYLCRTSKVKQWFSARLVEYKKAEQLEKTRQKRQKAQEAQRNADNPQNGAGAAIEEIPIPAACVGGPASTAPDGDQANSDDYERAAVDHYIDEQMNSIAEDMSVESLVADMIA